MEIPTKFYYSFPGNQQVKFDGQIVTLPTEQPQASFCSKPLINIQLLDSDNVAYKGLEATTAAQFMVDTDHANSPVAVPMGSDSWASTTGSEYSKPLSVVPALVYFDDAEASEGTKGSLAAGEWAYDSTSKTLHVRLSDSADPDTKADDFIEIKISGTDGTNPFIECYSDDFNQAGEWYDTDTSSFRAADITDGELSFRLNANTAAYYLRIGTNSEQTATAEIQFFNASAELFDVKKMSFICFNCILESDPTPLDVSPRPYYTITEMDALLMGHNEFTELTDTPANYTGAGGKFAKVNSGEDAVEFVDGAGRVVPTDESTDTTCFLLFVNAATGAVDVHTGTNITFNAATGALAVTSIAGANTNWDAAYTHVSNNGSDHSYIDQSVISGAAPTFVGTNFSGIPSGVVGAGAVEVDGSTPLTANWDVGNYTITANGLTLDGTFTDGTTSIAGGNYTGVGNITGADIDISAGTGDISTSGQISGGIGDFSSNSFSIGAGSGVPKLYFRGDGDDDNIEKTGANVLGTSARWRTGSGTVALPGMSFFGDMNTGIYSIGADQLGIATDGTLAVTVDASQNVTVHGNLTATTLVKSGGTSSQFLKADGSVDSNLTTDAITATSDGVAASLDTINTEVTTNGDSDLDNVTLANGISGQIKHIYCVVEGNAADTWKITPATMCGGTQITFAGVGEGCTLVYADSEGWVVIGNNGGTVS